MSEGSSRLPDLQKLMQRLEKLISDPRMQHLDTCYDLAKRARIRRLRERIEKDGEQYTETILQILEKEN